MEMGCCPVGRSFSHLGELCKYSKYIAFSYIHKVIVMLGSYVYSLLWCTGDSDSFCSLRQCMENYHWTDDN